MTDLLDYDKKYGLLDCDKRLALPFEEKDGIIYITGSDGRTSASKKNMWLDTTICGVCSLDLRTTESPYDSVCPQCGSDLSWRVMVTASC